MTTIKAADKAALEMAFMEEELLRYESNPRTPRQLIAAAARTITETKFYVEGFGRDRLEIQTTYDSLIRLLEDLQAVANSVLKRSPEGLIRQLPLDTLFEGDKYCDNMNGSLGDDFFEPFVAILKAQLILFGIYRACYSRSTQEFRHGDTIRQLYYETEALLSSAMRVLFFELEDLKDSYQDQLTEAYHSCNFIADIKGCDSPCVLKFYELWDTRIQKVDCSQS